MRGRAGVWDKRPRVECGELGAAPATVFLEPRGPGVGGRVSVAGNRPRKTRGSAMAELETRRREHDRLAAHFAALDDDALAAVLAPTQVWRINGLGNQSGLIEVDGVRVFVKTIALTAPERDAEGSTANHFGLPLFYQYGVGSAGFGAWRELKAQQRASAWVLSGECPHFPLLYHWRVLPRATHPLSDELRARIQRGVDHWEKSEAVRARLEAIAAAPAQIVLIIEPAPANLRQWLQAAGPMDAGLEAAILRVYDQWRSAAAFMNARGMLHFDLNPDNVLTDGEQLFVTDFGLTLCSDFDLAPAERGFFETHRGYDRAYVDGTFVRWLTDEIEPPPALTQGLRALVDRCTPVGAIFRAFLRTLNDETKTTPYPAEALEAAIAAQGGGG